MNNALILKGKIQHRPRENGGFGQPTLPAKSEPVKVEKIKKIRMELEKILEYWKNDTRFGGALITVYYNKVVAKSNRMQVLLKKDNANINSRIKGARFEKIDGKIKHVFTYFVSLETINKTIEILEKCIEILNDGYKGSINKDELKKVGELDDFKFSSKLSKSKFMGAIVDINYVEKFIISEFQKENIKNDSIVTLYETNINNDEFLKEINVNVTKYNKIDDFTYLLNKTDLEKIVDNASFLIAMSVPDMSIIPPIANNNLYEKKLTIDEPTNEPVVGVIDTYFDNNVYFKDWVTEVPMLDKNIEITSADKNHGTAVSSIIVDGQSFNEKLQDNCGRFKVKLFEVAKAGKNSAFILLKNIREIVRNNLDIKVWNISLGSPYEIEENFISPLAAELDRIQYEYGVIFVVAGTNKESDVDKIGSPADSLNSIVVNSVDFDNNPATYTRSGPVLSFFMKPDMCYYGGDKNGKIRVCEPLGEAMVAGTSFAAPWITRKIAFLIYKMGLTKEVAKAMLIDATAKWKFDYKNKNKKGYGIVPIDINEIVRSSDDEIKFIIYGEIEEFETYTYELPIPVNNEKDFPYFARATLAYFPYCDRNQGVDYTATELDLHFGRMGKDNKIKSINNNVQMEEEGYASEKEARDLYRKWDNVKHICDKITARKIPRKSYTELWGLSLKCAERLGAKKGKGMNFGIVITIKEMFGVNRIEDFINRCINRGWIVNKLDVENFIEIYNRGENDVKIE